MGNFDKGGRGGSGDRGGFGGGRPGGKPSFQKKSWGNDDRGRAPMAMHKATCSDCTKSCEVPFRPTGEKPVFCSDCFGGKKDSGRDGGYGNNKKSFDNRFEGRESFGAKKSFTSDRPERAQSPAGGAFGEDVKKQLTEISSKLDRLVNSIEKLTQTTVKSMPELATTKPVATAKPAPAPVKLEKKVVSVAKAVTTKAVAKTVVVAKPKAKAVAKTVVVSKAVVKKVVVKKVAKKVTKK